MSSAQPVESGFAEVNGARLYFEVAGSGHPLVLCHAGIADSRMWDDQIPVFAERYRTIRYDLRGFGKSKMPPGTYSLSEDLYGLLRFLGVERAFIIGASMGGATVVDFAITHPEMVAALIPVGAGLGGFDAPIPPEEEAIFEQVEQAAKAGDFNRANDLEVHIWVDGPKRRPEQVHPAVRERVREMNLPGFLRQDEYRQGQVQRLEPPAAERLREISAPTLVIYGDQDVSDIQTIAHKLAADIPGARLAVISDTAHVPNMEKPEEFNRLVLEFLSSVQS
jgi:3-oxoadipate enol-lactonase